MGALGDLARARLQALNAAPALPAPPRAESFQAFCERVAPNDLWLEYLAPLAQFFEDVRAGKRRRLLLSLPPQHGKTATALKGLVWLLACNPEWPLVYASYTADIARDKSFDARAYADRAGVTIHPDRDNLQHWKTPEGGGLLAAGIGTPLSGYAARVVVVDDPFKNRQEAESPSRRDTVHEWFTSVVLTRLPEDGSVLVVHARWNEDDLIGRLAKDDGWDIVALPFLTNAKGEADSDGDRPLAPQRALPRGGTFGWTPAGARERLREALPYDAATLYQQRTIVRGGKVFHVPSRYTDSNISGARIFLAVDAGGTDNTASDWTVAVALAVWWTVALTKGALREGRVVGIGRWRLRSTECAPELLTFQRRFGARMLIEGSRDGKEHGRVLKMLAPDIDIEFVTPIGDKLLRAGSAARDWNSSVLTVPVSPDLIDDPPENLSAFVHTVTNFTGQKRGEHDDDVDALAHAWNAALEAQPPAKRNGRPLLVGDRSRNESW